MKVPVCMRLQGRQWVEKGCGQAVLSDSDAEGHKRSPLPLENVDSPDWFAWVHEAELYQRVLQINIMLAWC